MHQNFQKAKIPRWHWGMNYFGIGNGRTVSLCDSRPWYGHFDYRNGLNTVKRERRKLFGGRKIKCDSESQTFPTG